MSSELLLQEWVNTFIDEKLLTIYEMQYTDIIIETDENFKLKFQDLLKPIALNQYKEYLIFSIDIKILYELKTKGELYKLFSSLLQESKEYQIYIGRIYQ